MQQIFSQDPTRDDPRGENRRADQKNTKHRKSPISADSLTPPPHLSLSAALTEPSPGGERSSLSPHCRTSLWRGAHEIIWYQSFLSLLGGFYYSYFQIKFFPFYLLQMKVDPYLAVNPDGCNQSDGNWAGECLHFIALKMIISQCNFSLDVNQDNVYFIQPVRCQHKPPNEIN